MQRDNGHYLINNSKVLYWQDGEWFKPVKSNGRYSGYISKIEKQPKLIKSIEKYNVGY